jgi:hypothetical protein
LSGGELAPPPRKSARLGSASVPLQLEESQEQISQGSHNESAVTPADARSVLAQTDVPAVMRPVFAARPMVANTLKQLAGTVLLWGGAGAVEAVFLRCFGDPALAQLFALSPYGDELPAAAQAGFLGTEAGSLQPPADQPSVLFAPAGVVFRGKKNLWAA